VKQLLALDLGTTTGWAIGHPGERITSGTWNLKPGKYEGGGMRYLKFEAALNRALAEAGGFVSVAFEAVRRHIGTDAAHVYGGLMATLTKWCEVNKIPYEGVPVGTIKKFATGKGNADKSAMMAAAWKAGYDPIDDNEADAIAIARLKLEAVA